MSSLRASHTHTHTHIGDNITPKLLEKAYLSFDKHTCGRIYQRLTVSLEQTLTKLFIVDRGLETIQVPLAPVDVEQAFRFISPEYLLKEWFASSTVTHMTKELRFTDPVTNAVTRVRFYSTNKTNKQPNFIVGCFFVFFWYLFSGSRERG